MGAVKLALPCSVHPHAHVRYPQSPQSKRGFRDLLGSGLLTSDPPLHDVQRRHIAPAFHFAKLKAMVPSMSAAATRAVDAWVARAGGVVDMNRELSRLTLSIISSCAFAADTSVGTNAAKAATCSYRDAQPPAPLNRRGSCWVRVPVFADLAEVQQAFTDNLLSPKLLGRCSPSHRRKRQRILANVEVNGVRSLSHRGAPHSSLASSARQGASARLHCPAAAAARA